MTKMIIMTITPLLCTGYLAAGNSPAYLEYGALGLCAIMVGWLCRHTSKLTEANDRKDKVLSELYAENTKAYNRLADLLEDRPCLMKDKRIKPDDF